MRARFLFRNFPVDDAFSAHGRVSALVVFALVVGATLLLFCGCSSAERTPKGIFDAFKPDRVTRFFSEDDAEDNPSPREKNSPPREKNPPKNTASNIAQNTQQPPQNIIQQNALRDAIKTNSPKIDSRGLPQLVAPQTASPAQAKPNLSPPPPPPPEPQLPSQTMRAIPGAENVAPRTANANEETSTARVPGENHAPRATAAGNTPVIPPAPTPVLPTLSPRATLVPLSELTSDPPELKLLLSDLKNAAEVDAEKSIKLVSELRKIDAESDPAFYKNMVGFARTTLLQKTTLTNVGDEPVDENVATVAATPREKNSAAVSKPATRSARVAPRVEREEESVASVLNAETEELAENLIAPPLLPSAARAPITQNSTPQNDSPPNSQKSPEIPAVRFVTREENSNESKNSGNPPTSIVPVSYLENSIPRTNETNRANVNGGTADDWQASVRHSCALLRSRAVSTQDEVRLRLLELALGNQQEAARPIDGIETSTRAFWASEMLGLSVLLDERTFPETSSRNAAAIHHLARAQNDLRQQCPLKIQQMKFVDKWYGFGSYTPLAGDFNVGETVSLYLELENITVRESPLGHNTRSSTSYVLLDGAGTVVARVENITAEETSQARRRDSCLMIPVTIPKTISPGPYQLKITVTDLNHDKLQYAVEQVSLRIKSSYPQNGE